MSGSVAIISIGVLVAFGVMFPAVVDSSHRVSEAQATQSDRILDQQNTEITIDNATYDGTNLTVDVVNEGTTALDVEETDVLVDGRYIDLQPDETTVYRALNKTDGDATTSVWLSGEVLEVTVGVDFRPDRVKVVTETGVADSTEAVQ